MQRRDSVTWRRVLVSGALVPLMIGLSACSGTVADADSDATGGATSSVGASSALWDAAVAHDISVTIDDQDAYDELVSTYLDTGEKVWISVSVTIDGTTFENVGMRLKGNSSLRTVTESTAQESPETLPWIIRLDKFVDGQSYEGETDLVIRGNSSETSLNEAVALSLLEEAGLASESAVESRFSVNGGEAALRLVVQNPSDEWVKQEFGEGGLLYKAESDGDYSYRGDDPDAYTDVFDQEAGDDDLTPLIEFLQFINESDDATFAAELGGHLDIEAFARYLAFQDLVDNMDDIDGPGNNSYLYYDEHTGMMTVVSWDLNLAFGASPGNGGGGGQAPDGAGQAPDGGGQGAPAQGDAGGGAPGGGMSGSNVLAERFLANDEFAALYTQAQSDLEEELVQSGVASDIVDTWSEVLTDQASDLVEASIVESEAAAIDAVLEDEQRQ